MLWEVIVWYSTAVGGYTINVTCGICGRKDNVKSLRLKEGMQFNDQSIRDYVVNSLRCHTDSSLRGNSLNLVFEWHMPSSDARHKRKKYENVLHVLFTQAFHCHHMVWKRLFLRQEFFFIRNYMKWIVCFLNHYCGTISSMALLSWVCHWLLVSTCQRHNEE